MDKRNERNREVDTDCNLLKTTHFSKDRQIFHLMTLMKKISLRGLEALTLASLDRCSKNVSFYKTKICETAKGQLTPKSENRVKLTPQNYRLALLTARSNTFGHCGYCQKL